MAKKIEKPKLVEVLRTLEYTQQLTIVDMSDLEKANVYTLKEMINECLLDKIKLEDEVEKMTIRDNVLVIYVDVVKARMIERQLRKV